MAKKKSSVRPLKAKVGSAQEVCCGCGAKADQHPIIAVVNEDDAEGHTPVFASLDNPGFKGLAVCAACHQDPAHRTTPIKAHFFERNVGKYAVQRAGSDQLGV